MSDKSNLLKDGQPKYIQVYKAREDVLDKWTVVFTRVCNWVSDVKSIKEQYRGISLYIGMDVLGGVYHGQIDRLQCPHPNYGKRISYECLNPAQKKAVISEYESCWKIAVDYDDNGICTKAQSIE